MTNNIGPRSHDSKGEKPILQKTEATQGRDVGEGSSQGIVASRGPQGTAKCMMMRQKGGQEAVSLRGHGHEGLVLIACWMQVGAGDRAWRQSSGVAALRSKDVARRRMDQGGG
jgi:hypothetical protein